MRAAWTLLRRPAAALALATLTTLLAGALAGQDPGPPAAFRIGNRSARTYHRPDCELARRLPARTKVALADPAAAARAGYKPCATCRPEADSDSPDAEPDRPRPAPRKGRRTSREAAPLRFSRDVAPILKANCQGCHNPQQKRGEFDLTTFRTLLAGSESGPVIVPGIPDQSRLVQLVVDREMPRGNDRRLSDEAIETIRRWVAEGARLDTSDPNATLDAIAPSEDQLRRESLAELEPDELLRKVEAAGLERIKKASPNARPVATPGRGFVVLGELPEARAKALVRVAEAQKAALIDLLGEAAAAGLGGPEPIGVYVLKDRNAYTEFVRGIEQREPELGVMGHARLTVENPYVVAIDPLAGGDEPAAPSNRGRASRKRRDDEFADAGPQRGLAGIVAEALAAGTVQAGGRAPRWLAEGLGALAAAQVEPGSPYIARLRGEAARQIRLGWMTKATEALGDQGAPEVVRALGFSLCECLASTARPRFAPFVRALATQGGGQVDAVIRDAFGPEATRERFLEQWGAFVAQSYDPRRR
jgi:hypothetical protein